MGSSKSRGPELSLRKRAEKAMNESEERYRLIAETSSDVIVVIDEDSRITYVSPSAEQVFGYLAGELVGGRITMLMPESLRDAHLTGVKRYLATGERTRDWKAVKLHGKHKSGREIPVEVSFGEFVQSGKRAFVGLIRDNTEQKKAENALREDAQHLRQLAAIVEQTDDIVYITGRGGIIEYVNPAFEHVTGYAREEAVGATPSLLKSGMHDPDFYQHLWETIIAGKPFHAVIINRKKSGEHFHEEKTITPLRDEKGRITHFVSTGKDITERRRADVERERLLGVLEASLNEIYIFATDTLRFQYVNPSALRNLGYGAEVMRALTPIDLKPEFSVASFRDRIAPLLRDEQELVVFQTTHRRADRSVYPVEVHLQLVGSGGDRVFLAVIFDITERKRAEREHAQLAAIVETSNDAIISCDLDRLIVTWNAAAERLFGYTAAEIIGANAILLVPAGQHAEADLRLARLKEGIPIQTYEAVRLGKGGKRVEISGTVSPINDSGGRLTGISLIYRDIGERKRAESEHAQLAAIVESSNDAILMRGPEGTILSWNAAAERLFGWTVEEALGQQIELILPPDRTGKFRRLIEREPGAVPSGPVEATHQHKDGWRIPTQITFSPVHDQKGALVAHSYTVRDMTELKRNERAVRALSRRLREVEEAERRAIARELHDRIGQELSTLGLVLGSFNAALPQDAQLALSRQLQDAQGLLKSVVSNVRDVMAELRPPLLDEYGLLAALRQLATEFNERSGIAAELSGIDVQPRLSSIVETAMFRISQEALSNVAKHARAKSVEICLYAASGRFVLEIADDGIGFDMGEMGRGRERWGLRTMRERAEAVGIGFRLESTPGSGSRIVLEVVAAPA